MDIGSIQKKNFQKIIKVVLYLLKFIFKGKKIICNSGYFQNHKHKLNRISKSTATHSTLIFDNKSASTLKK